MSAIKRDPFILPLELVRGFAALSIVVLHMILFSVRHMDAVWPEFTSHILHIGVDVFFVLSGFIMVHTTRHGSRHPRDFFIKRILRIYPAYWLVTLALLPVLFLKPEWVNSASAVPPKLLQSFTLWPQAGLPLLMVAWTLTFEMYFYVLFAMTLFLKPMKQWLVLVTGLCASVVIGVIAPQSSPVAQLVTSPLLLEFALGMMLGMMWPHWPRSVFLPVLCFASAVLWLIYMPLSEHSRMIAFALPATLIVAVFLSLDILRVSIPKRFALFAGGISYALYLVHVPIIAGLARIVPLWGMEWTAGSMMVSGCVLSIAVAAVLHYGFEKPFQSVARSLMLRHSRKDKGNTL